jgi:polyhydroxyalkanoate synthase subunit PhaC
MAQEPAPTKRRAPRKRSTRSPSGARAASTESPRRTRTATERLLEPAADSVVGNEAVAIPSASSIASGLVSLLTQGSAIASEAAQLTVEGVRIVRGRSSVGPAKGDSRFADQAWTSNPAYHRVEQGYLAWCASMDRLAKRANNERAKFTVSLLTSALAPTNTLLNPAAVKRVFDTGGSSLVSGAKNFVGDLRHNGGMPSTADRNALQVGRDLALTPGAVVTRDEKAELMQYTPTTERVRSRPVLVVPPPIGRYYFLDLRPSRSFVEYGVSRGLQTFILSWRNPGKAESDWDMDAYAQRVLDAVDEVREITGSEQVDLIAFCAGGIISSAVLSHLAAIGEEKVATISFAVTLLDFGGTAPIQAFSSARLLSLARRNSRRAGVISSRAMGTAFSLMRPNELVWNYWVNNYLLGQNPPVFDILSWNADGTNLPAALHGQFLDIFERNSLVEPGAMTVLGTPLDLGSIKQPSFVTGAVTDHLTPWKGTYQTTQLMAGPTTFVLSNSGHIQSLVNPPGNPKASFFAGGKVGPDADAWLASAEQHSGSWWEEWAKWIWAQDDADRAAPRQLGSAEHPAGVPAPGTYVSQG